MNLCLHQAGKLQCVPIASSVLDILVRLLVRDLKQVQRSKNMQHRNMQDSNKNATRPNAKKQ